MKNFKGDLLESNVDIICHVANMLHTFGSGIAYFIKNKYPEAYQADLDTEYGCESKMGTFSKAYIQNKGMVIYNLYSMWGLGNDGNPLHRNLSYDNFFNGLHNICKDIGVNPVRSTIVGLPKYIGCCRAGGNWEIVSTMIQEVEKLFPNIEFHIYELENGEMTAQSTQPI